ncbi:hypothetical protein VTH82DRAFT_3979 [Thermothelomyces myriococcoides]
MALLLGVDIPVEVVELIVKQLDPITLISLSQTSRWWRAFINPTRHDFEQRLLALELTPEHSGLVPVFDEISQKLSPPWESDEWRTARYACCGCMKLLSHMMFDNVAILRRPYRKPSPGSVEAQKMAVTDWERLEPAARWRRIRERAAHEEEERERWRKVVRRRHERQAPNHHHHPFALLPRSLDLDSDEKAMRHLVGTARHKRRCVECLYQSGATPYRGSLVYDYIRRTSVPAFRSRHLRFRLSIERMYPGLVRPPWPLPREWRALRRAVHGTYYALSVIRCPSCQTWQEYAAFRQVLRRHHMSWFNEECLILCDRCHLETYGNPDLLAETLRSLAREHLEDYRKTMAYYIRTGWSMLCRDFYSGYLCKCRHVGDEILKGLRIESKFDEYTIAGVDDVLDHRTLDDLLSRFRHYLQWLDTELDSADRSFLLQNWFQNWVEDYELIDRAYRWVTEQIAWLDSHPRAVLDYVLEKDPHRIQSRRKD